MKHLDLGPHRDFARSRSEMKGSSQYGQLVVRRWRRCARAKLLKLRLGQARRGSASRGHEAHRPQTEAVYRRYAITDSAMLQEAAVKLSVLQASEANRPSSVQVKELSAKG